MEMSNIGQVALFVIAAEESKLSKDVICRFTSVVTRGDDEIALADEVGQRRRSTEV